MASVKTANVGKGFIILKKDKRHSAQVTEVKWNVQLTLNQEVKPRASYHQSTGLSTREDQFSFYPKNHFLQISCTSRLHWSDKIYWQVAGHRTSPMEPDQSLFKVDSVGKRRLLLVVIKPVTRSKLEQVELKERCQLTDGAWSKYACRYLEGWSSEGWTSHRAINGFWRWKEKIFANLFKGIGVN